MDKEGGTASNSGFSDWLPISIFGIYWQLLVTIFMGSLATTLEDPSMTYFQFCQLLMAGGQGSPLAYLESNLSI